MIRILILIFGFISIRTAAQATQAGCDFAGCQNVAAPGPNPPVTQPIPQPDPTTTGVALDQTRRPASEGGDSGGDNSNGGGGGAVH